MARPPHPSPAEQAPDPAVPAAAALSEAERLERLNLLVRRAEYGLDQLRARELVELTELYRYASTEIARLEASDHDPSALANLRDLVSRTHRLLYRPASDSPASGLAHGVRFLLVDSPAAIWEERQLLGGMLALFYGLCVVAFLAVSADLELAYALQPPESVRMEIDQLRETAPGEAFRGNFTFGLGQSSLFSGMILANNIFVSMLFFGAALVPPQFLYILVNNALMVGTYTGVAGHWDQAGAISSILWCHGVIELQMIILAGAAGLILVRAWVAPGPWSRGHAMARESSRAWALLAPIFPLLTLSGLIEGYISPHAPLPVRVAVGAGTGALLVLWVVHGVRQSRAAVTPLGVRSDSRAAARG